MQLSNLTYLLFILLVGLLSCSSPKKTQNKMQSDIHYDADYIGRLIDSLRSNMESQIDIINERAGKVKIDNKTVYLSDPDSTGKQHPTAISETKTVIDGNESNKSTNKTVIDLSNILSRADSVSVKEDSSVKEELKETKLSWWDLHKDKVYVAIIFLFVALAMWFKFRKKIN